MTRLNPWFVLIVAKCIVNVIDTETGELREMVLIVAKCIVNNAIPFGINCAI